MTAASTPATPFFPITEDDMVNQQMARLLLQERDRAGNDQQSTFRIQWPTDDDDEADPAQRGIRMRTRTGSGSRLIPPNRLGAALSAAQAAQGIRPAQTTAGTGAEASRAARLSPFRGGDSARATDVEVERGRAEAQLTGVPRSKSREDRRKEIEMGNMEGTVNRSWR